MGCCAVTCGITNTAIFEDEKTVMIIFKQDFKIPRKFNRLIDDLHQERFMNQLQRKTDQNIIQDILIGRYDDYRWLKEYSVTYARNKDNYIENAQYFHKWAVETLMDGKLNLEYVIKENFVRTLYYKIADLRRSPLDNSVGVQHDGVVEMMKQIEINEATNAFLIDRLLKLS